MSTPRAASGLLVSALLRAAGRDGGFAAVLARGDQQAGGIVLVIRERGTLAALRERHGQEWRIAGPAILEEDTVEEYCRRARSRDPDLWLAELDVPAAQRFIDALPGLS